MIQRARCRPHRFWSFRHDFVLLLLVLSCTSKSTLGFSTTAPSNGFWNGPLPFALPDPPSPERLALIQASPYRGGFEPASDVDPYSPRIVQGSIPSDLVGCLAGNGPGRIRIGDSQYGHWFDGDGYVTLLSFQEGQARYCAKYVRTNRFRDQEELMSTLQDDEKVRPPLAFAGAWTLRGRGEWFENILRIPTNPANTATLWLSSDHHDQPRLYALCEGGNPIELNPHTADTIGEDLPWTSRDGKSEAQSFFSAHFSKCPMTGEVFNHGYMLNTGPGPTQLNVMKYTHDGVLLGQEACDLPFDTFVHDSTMSENFLVYFLPPYRQTPGMSMYKFVLGLEAIGNLSEWDPKGDTFVHVHSRSNLKLQWQIRLPRAINLYHLVDAHEEEQQDGSILLRVRVSEYLPPDRILLEKQFKDQYRVPDGTRVYTKLREYVFLLKNDGEAEFLSNADVASDCAPCEFPTIHASWKPGNRRRYCWVNALSKPSAYYLNGVQKIDMQEGKASEVVSFGPGNYGGAPSFVPKASPTSEDDGYVIVSVYKTLEHRSDVVILDAKTMKQLCVLELTSHIPYQFHGEFLAIRPLPRGHQQNEHT